MQWAGFQNGLTTLHHILTIRALIEEGRYLLLLCGFQKAFDTVLNPHFMQQLEALGVPVDMQWGIYALYESVSGKVQSSKGLSKAMASTIE